MRERRPNAIRLFFFFLFILVSRTAVLFVFVIAQRKKSERSCYEYESFAGDRADLTVYCIQGSYSFESKLDLVAAVKRVGL